MEKIMSIEKLTNPTSSQLVELIKAQEQKDNTPQTHNLFLQCYQNHLYAYMRADNYDWNYLADNFLEKWTENLELKINNRITNLFHGIPFRSSSKEYIGNFPNIIKLTNTQLEALDFTLKKITKENISIPENLTIEQFHKIYKQLSTIAKILLCINSGDHLTHPSTGLKKILLDSLIFTGLPTIEQQYTHHLYHHKVEHISLNDIHHDSLIFIRNPAIEYILGRFSNLESLDLTNCCSLTKSCLTPYHEKLKSLTTTGTSILPKDINSNLFKKLEIVINQRPIVVAFVDDILDPLCSMETLLENILKATFLPPFKKISLDLILNSYAEDPEKYLALIVQIWNLSINTLEFDTVGFIDIVLNSWTNSFQQSSQEQGSGSNYLSRTYLDSNIEEFPERALCHRICNFIISILNANATPMHIKSSLLDSIRTELTFGYPEKYHKKNTYIWSGDQDHRASYAIGSISESEYQYAGTLSNHTLIDFYQQERIEYFISNFSASSIDSSYINGNDGMVDKICRKILYLQQELITKSIYSELKSYTVSAGVLETAVSILAWISHHDKIDVTAIQQIATVYKKLLINPSNLKNTHKEGSIYQLQSNPILKTINNAVTLQMYIKGRSYSAEKEYKFSIPYILASFFAVNLPINIKDTLHRQLIREFKNYKEKITSSKVVLDEHPYEDEFGPNAHIDYHLANIITGSLSDEDIPPQHRNEFISNYLKSYEGIFQDDISQEIKDLYFEAFCNEQLGITNFQFLDNLFFLHQQLNTSNEWKDKIKQTLEKKARSQFKFLPIPDPTGLTGYVYNPGEIQKKARELLDNFNPKADIFEDQLL